MAMGSLYKVSKETPIVHSCGEGSWEIRISSVDYTLVPQLLLPCKDGCYCPYCNTDVRRIVGRIKYVAPPLNRAPSRPGE